MKIKKEVFIGMVVIAAAFSIFIWRMVREKDKDQKSLASRITEIGNNPTESIESLQKAIASYERRIEQHVKDAAQTGVYWKILAVRFQDKGLHNEALEALERAIYYNNEDGTLHYLTGVSAARSAKSQHDFSGIANSERDRLYNLAEEAFLTAIELDEKYIKPHYSLAVLYAFDLDRPAEAVPHLLRYLEYSRNDIDALFVLARSYYMLSSYREAVEIYDRIISITKDETRRLEAQNNRQIAMGLIYG